jgi:tetratricopeptide (TPR) repeat protein
MQVLDAHNLYVETAAELGLVGLVLLLVAFAVPLGAARELRRLPLGAPALSVWIAFLFHAGVDWDWEMPAVTATALIVAAAPLSALRSPRSESGPRLRLGGLGLALLLALLALAFLPGNLEIATARSANDRGHFAAAARHAQRAARFAPWSSQPPFQRALALVALGRRAEAATSASKALSYSPNDWRLWALLARVTRGSEQQHALARLRTLNPLAPNPRTLSLQDLG